MKIVFGIGISCLVFSGGLSNGQPPVQPPLPPTIIILGEETAVQWTRLLLKASVVSLVYSGSQAPHPVSEIIDTGKKWSLDLSCNPVLEKRNTQGPAEIVCGSNELSHGFVSGGPGHLYWSARLDSLAPFIDLLGKAGISVPLSPLISGTSDSLQRGTSLLVATTCDPGTQKGDLQCQLEVFLTPYVPASRE